MVSYIMNTKNCMSTLLLSDHFDTFSFISGEITTYCTYKIDGTFHPEFYPDTQEIQKNTYIEWRQVREHCFHLIKGKQTPLHFHFILSLSPEQLQAFLQKENLPWKPEDIQGLYLNFRFDGSRLTCTTGTSFHTFVLDKTLEHLWDNMIPKLFTKKGLEYELNQ